MTNFKYLSKIQANLEQSFELKKIKVQIETPNKNHLLTCRPGLGVQAIALKNNIAVDFDCLKADCGVCIAKVCSGADGISAPTANEIDFLKAMNADKDERLMCQCRIFSDCHLKIEY